MNNPAARIFSIFLALFLVHVTTAAHAAFDGPRVYWPLPKNTNILAGHLINGTANASWSNWSAIQPNVDIQSDIYLLTYTRVQPVFDRTIYWQAALPMGTTNTSSILPIDTQDTFTNGLGDPSVGATINLFGTPGLKAKDFVRHEQNLSINLGVNVTAPWGQYDNDESLNIGSNQWKTRISAPIVKSFGAWVPGSRTTLEIMPSVMFFGDNDDALGGDVEQDPLYGVEVHLTRDITQKAFISLDYTWLEGGEERLSSANGTIVRETDGIDAGLMGVTLGFEVNDNLRLFLTHMQTISEGNDAFELEGSLTKLTLSWSWHDVLEKVRTFRN